MKDTLQRIGCFWDVRSHKSQELFRKLSTLYPWFEQASEDKEYDIIVTIGGDGLMLKALHRFMNKTTFFYGLNLGSIGFLLNDVGHIEELLERFIAATPTILRPLEMEAETVNGEIYKALAINEISLLRQTHQTAKMEVLVNGYVRLPEIVSDGILVSTPAGSTAYNYAAHGPIVPLQANVLLLTPISPFRPRRWRGAILSADSVIELRMLEKSKRPISVSADFMEFRNVTRVTVKRSSESHIALLFDKDNSFEERVLKEQFSY